jgi:hypothetical protein
MTWKRHRFFIPYQATSSGPRPNGKDAPCPPGRAIPPRPSGRTMTRYAVVNQLPYIRVGYRCQIGATGLRGFVAAGTMRDSMGQLSGILEKLPLLPDFVCTPLFAGCRDRRQSILNFKQTCSGGRIPLFSRLAETRAARPWCRREEGAGLAAFVLRTRGCRVMYVARLVPQRTWVHRLTVVILIAGLD